MSLTETVCFLKQLKNKWVKILTFKREPFEKYIGIPDLVQFLPYLIFLMEERSHEKQMWEAGLSNVPKSHIQFVLKF